MEPGIAAPRHCAAPMPELRRTDAECRRCQALRPRNCDGLSHARRRGVADFGSAALRGHDACAWGIAGTVPAAHIRAGVSAVAGHTLCTLVIRECALVGRAI